MPRRSPLPPAPAANHITVIRPGALEARLAGISDGIFSATAGTSRCPAAAFTALCWAACLYGAIRAAVWTLGRLRARLSEYALIEGRALVSRLLAERQAG